MARWDCLARMPKKPSTWLNQDALVGVSLRSAGVGLADRLGERRPQRELGAVALLGLELVLQSFLRQATYEAREQPDQSRIAARPRP